MKHGNFEQQIRNCPVTQLCLQKRRVPSFLLDLFLFLFGFLLFAFTKNSENVPINEHEY